ncbi:MAG: hypothetical protein WBK32_09455 [Candidatus Saccharicenans sp.]
MNRSSKNWSDLSGGQEKAGKAPDFSCLDGPSLKSFPAYEQAQTAYSLFYLISLNRFFYNSRYQLKRRIFFIN